MQIKVTARHLELTEPLRSYAESKVTRVTKVLDEVIDAHIILFIERYRHIAELTIKTNQTIIHGQGESEDMYKAIDSAVEKVERQMLRFKGKYRVPAKGRLEQEKFINSEASYNEEEDVNPEETEVEDETEPRVIKSKRYAVKPMSLEEAVMQMKTLSNNFLVFTNANNDEVNVLYRRRDGNFGLIEPEME